MDILIKGIKKLPEDGDYIHLIIQNGKVHTAISCGYLTTDKLNVGTVVKVPPHGRLIDADRLKAIIRKANEDCFSVGKYERAKQWSDAEFYVDHAPTVLEAST